MMKYHHIINILASKAKSEINDNHVTLGNLLKYSFGKTNEMVKVIDIIRDHSNDIINNIDSMYDILADRKTKKGYNAFATKTAIEKAISFLKSNIALIEDLATQCGWYVKVKLFAKKAVICITTGERYGSMKEAAQAMNCSASGISKCCRGVQKTTAKLQFKYEHQ
jgi:plasmid maintenance system antidote protein VapI